METPLLERPNVTNLLDVTVLEDCYPTELGGDIFTAEAGKMITARIESFYNRYQDKDIVIQLDGHEEPLGIIIDAYNGEDDIDSDCIWFDQYIDLPF